MARLLFVIAAALALLAGEGPALAGQGDAASTVRADDGVRLAQRSRRRRSRRRRRRPRKAAPKKAPPTEEKAAQAETGSDEGQKAQTSGSPLRRSNRMEFDARLVQGQTAQSGAVYLFQRAPRRLPPLLQLHQSYLDRIVDPVLGPDHETKKKKKEDR